MKMLTKFGFQDMYPQQTPMMTSQVANKEQKQREETEKVNKLIATDCENRENRPYREAIGTLFSRRVHLVPIIIHTAMTEI